MLVPVLHGVDPRIRRSPLLYKGRSNINFGRFCADSSPHFISISVNHSFNCLDTFGFFNNCTRLKNAIIQIGSGEPFGNELADEEDRERHHGGGGGGEDEDEEEEWGEWEDEGDWEASVGSDSRWESIRLRKKAKARK